MKVSRATLSLAVFCFALMAATMPSAAAPDKKQAAVKSDLTSDLVANLTRAGKQLVSLAEATPADKFSWRPNDQVRRISEVYMHVVGPNMLLPSMLGAAPPKGLTIPDKPFDLAQKWESEVTSKEAVIAKLRESFDYAAEAIKTIPASEFNTEVSAFGFPASKRAYLLILLSHAHEHLGQSIAYARSIGVVPPWSAPKEAAPEKSGK